MSLFLKVILSSEETSHVLPDLDPDTLYEVTVTAIYPDESESEDLIGSQRTCKAQIHMDTWVQAHPHIAQLQNIYPAEWNWNNVLFSWRLFLVSKIITPGMLFQKRWNFDITVIVMVTPVLVMKVLMKAHFRKNKNCMWTAADFGTRNTSHPPVFVKIILSSIILSSISFIANVISFQSRCH